MGKSRGGVSRSRAGHSAAVKRGGVSRSRAGHSAAVKRVQVNHRRGIAFEKRVTAAVKHSCGIKSRSVKTQVSTKRHGRADIVAKTTSGKKVVIEAKNFHGNPLTKANVKQVHRYGKDLHAKPMLIVSKTTTVPSSVKKFANAKSVPIQKM